MAYSDAASGAISSVVYEPSTLLPAPWPTAKPNFRTKGDSALGLDRS